MPSTKRDKQLKRWAARREMAYRLHHESGHSFSEIAKKLGVTSQRAWQLVVMERERRGGR